MRRYRKYRDRDVFNRFKIVVFKDNLQILRLLPHFANLCSVDATNNVFSQFLVDRGSCESSWTIDKTASSCAAEPEASDCKAKFRRVAASTVTGLLPCRGFVAKGFSFAMQGFRSLMVLLPSTRAPETST
jgi:hypothetical protein